MSHYRTKLSVDKYCVIGDIMVLLCHVISQDYAIKGSNILTVI